MKQMLFWHVVSHSEENDKQVPASLLSTHQIQKYLDPISSLPQVHCSIKRNTTDFKKKAEQQSTIQLGDWENRNWKCGGLHAQNTAICWPTPPSWHTTGSQAMVRTEEPWDRHMIRKINSRITAAGNGKWPTWEHSDMLIVLLLEHSSEHSFNNALSVQVWADVLLRPRALYLFKSPDFNVLDKEIFLLRKRMIPKRFTGMASSMVEISIKPKGKFSSETHQNNY